MNLRRFAPPVEPLPQRVPGKSLKDNPAPKEPTRPLVYRGRHRSNKVATDLTHQPAHLFAKGLHRVGDVLRLLAVEETYA